MSIQIWYYNIYFENECIGNNPMDNILYYIDSKGITNPSNNLNEISAINETNSKKHLWISFQIVRIV